MNNSSLFSQPLDPVEISLLEQDIRGQAQAAAAQAVVRGVRRLIGKIRHSFGSTAQQAGLRSA